MTKWGFGGTDISECGRYRYYLERRLEELVAAPPVTWLMINPSTANATVDDPTIRKVMGFTKRAGYGSFIVVNLYALRETDIDKVRQRLDEAEGPRNADAIIAAAKATRVVVCAWGAKPWARPQVERVLSWIQLAQMELGKPIRLLCLGTTKDGDPIHPLMPSYDGHPLVPFTPRIAAAPQNRSLQ